MQIVGTFIELKIFMSLKREISAYRIGFENLNDFKAKTLNGFRKIEIKLNKFSEIPIEWEKH